MKKLSLTLFLVLLGAVLVGCNSPRAATADDLIVAVSTAIPVVEALPTAIPVVEALPTAIPVVEQATAIPVVEQATAILSDTAALIPEPPADRWQWMENQVFSPTVCDPHTYLWWVELGFDPTGSHVDVIDLVLPPGQRALAYGSDVTVNGVDMGRRVVYFDGPGRWSVQITDGAHRVGQDDGRMGLFPEYYAQVLRCLYGGIWEVIPSGMPLPTS